MLTDCPVLPLTLKMTSGFEEQPVIPGLRGSARKRSDAVGVAHRFFSRLGTRHHLAVARAQSRHASAHMLRCPVNDSWGAYSFVSAPRSFAPSRSAGRPSCPC